MDIVSFCGVVPIGNGTEVTNCMKISIRVIDDSVKLKIAN